MNQVILYSSILSTQIHDGYKKQGRQ